MAVSLEDVANILDLNKGTNRHDKAVYGEVKAINSDKTYQVSLNGSDTTVKCARLSGAKVGDTVLVEILSNGYAVVTGTVGGDTDASDAQQSATAAQTAAGQAQTAASAAQTAAATAETAATNAVTQAEAASAAAQIADSKATAAGTAAAAAQTSADNAASAAATADDKAEAASAAATRAEGKADTASAAASSAETSATQAAADARAANESAIGALDSLSTVQDVVGTLNWIAEHGAMTLTSDTELNPSHVYFVLNDPPTGQTEPHGDYYVGGHYYDVVSEPNVADISTYYELTIDESLNNYVGTHLALTDEGLYVLGDDEGWKVLIRSDGVYIVNPRGAYVAQYKSDILLGNANYSHLHLTSDTMELVDNDAANQLTITPTVNDITMLSRKIYDGTGISSGTYTIYITSDPVYLVNIPDANVGLYYNGEIFWYSTIRPTFTISRTTLSSGLLELDVIINVGGSGSDITSIEDQDVLGIAIRDDIVDGYEAVFGRYDEANVKIVSDGQFILSDPNDYSYYDRGALFEVGRNDNGYRFFTLGGRSKYGSKGRGSISIGAQNEVEGTDSLALGNTNIVEADNAVAIGLDNSIKNAYAMRSVTAGVDLIAGAYEQTVYGCANNESYQYPLVIGNGYSRNNVGRIRRNALAFSYGGNDTLLSLLSFYLATSSTAAGTTTKVVTLSDSSINFELVDRACVTVTFTNESTTTTSLNVAGTGAKPAYINGSRITASNCPWSAGGECSFIYNAQKDRWNAVTFSSTDSFFAPADETLTDSALAWAIQKLGWTSDVIE